MDLLSLIRDHADELGDNPKIYVQLNGNGGFWVQADHARLSENIEPASIIIEVDQEVY